jgi:RNA polymerase II C-terminal domain phosphatase-like 3/4
MQPALKRRAVVRQRAGAAPADPTGSAVSASGLPATSVPPSCSSDDDSQSAWDRAWAADAEDEAEEAEQDGVGYLWGMNIVTGEVRGDTTGSEASDAEARRRRGLVQFTYGTYEGVELSASEVRKLKAEERASLLASRKLVLVLDLDHTLLNSATLHELSTQQADAVAAAAGVPKWTVPPAPAVSAAAAELVVEGEEDLIEEEEEGGEAGGDGDGAEGGAADGLSCRAHMNGAAADTASGVASAPSAAAASSSAGPSSSDGHAAGAAASVVGAPVGAPGGAVGLHWLPHLGLWTKLRPGLNDFLRATVGQFELYVYTMGARKYAAAVVEVLDPDGNLGLRGKDRVIASEDSTSRRLKGLDVVLGAEETTVSENKKGRGATGDASPLEACPASYPSSTSAPCGCSLLAQSNHPHSLPPPPPPSP